MAIENCDEIYKFQSKYDEDGYVVFIIHTDHSDEKQNKKYKFWLNKGLFSFNWKSWESADQQTAN